jgi:hypothetical protein
MQSLRECVEESLILLHCKNKLGAARRAAYFPTA